MAMFPSVIKAILCLKMKGKNIPLLEHNALITYSEN